MSKYIPTEVLATAICALHDQLEANSKKKFKQEDLLVSYEVIELKESWTTIPTLYKILLKNNDFSQQLCAFGIWTEKGQQIETI